MKEMIGTCLIMIGFIVARVLLTPMTKREKIGGVSIISVIIVLICTGVYLL